MADASSPWRKAGALAFSACLCFALHLAKEVYLRPLYPLGLKLAPRLACEFAASAAVAVVWIASYLRLAGEKGLNGILNVAINVGGLSFAGMIARYL